MLQDDFRDTALVIAVDQGHLHVAEILVKNGVNVNYRNKVRALIPVTQVCIMSPVIRHVVNQWDGQGMTNKQHVLFIADMHTLWFLPLTLIKYSLCPLVLVL